MGSKTLRMTTIKDIASRAGVSFKTVSRVVNGVPSVDPDTRARVQATIQEMGYVPNQAARQLRGTPRTIGFLYDNPNSNYVVEVQEGIIEACRSMGYEVLIHPVKSTDADAHAEVLRLGQRAEVGGLVLTPPLSENVALIDQLLDSGIAAATVVSGAEPPDSRLPTVHVDDRYAARTLTNKLVDLGHREIAFFEGDAGHQSTQERRQGWEEALIAHGLSADRGLVLPGEYTFSSGVERADELLQKMRTVTAIIACNDEIAAGVLFSARRLGLRIPHDLSIVGFEDSPFSRQSWPNLTTARQSNRSLGAHAARLLMESLSSGEMEASAPAIAVQPEVLFRDSIAPPAAV
ncbi:MAG: LacI family DNA-binding transcriptional regulator [Pseudomonadota bacterium]